MGSMSVVHWLIVLVIVLLLFGANKIPTLMGDMAKGVKAFRTGLRDEEGELLPPNNPGDKCPNANGNSGR